MRLLKKRLNNSKISKKNKDLEPEEVFWDAFLHKKKENIFKNKLEVALAPTVIWGLRAVFALLVLFILFKTYQLQVLEHEKYSVLASKNKFFVQSLYAQRGVVYDKNYKQIVINKPNFDLVFKKHYFPQDPNEREKILKKVAWALDEDIRNIEKKVLLSEEKEKYILKDLSYKQLIFLESNIEELKGFFIYDSSIREYVDGPVFAHVLGYYRKSGDSAGIELYYNEELSPKPGQTMAERDVHGNIITKEIVSLPNPGNSLVLHLDADLQKYLYETMEQEMEKAGVKRGVAVALDPNTGGVLAMTSFPSYDNNLFSYDISHAEWAKLSSDKNLPFLNRVVSGRYATGSVIKPLIGIAALEQGVISKKTSFDCRGEIVIENPWFPDQPFVYKDWTVHGVTDIRKAIAQSSNVFFYIIGGGYEKFKGLGADKIKEYLELFGWNQETGIDMPGETNSFIPNREWKRDNFSSPNNIWMLGDTYNLSIGQGYLSVSPLAVASSIVAIANGGTLYKPKMVQKIINEEREIIEELYPEIIRKDFLKIENVEIIRLGMKDAVEYGSAIALKNLPVTAGAKTGTAETGKRGYYHNWITVFAPYENPEIVITLMVEEVRGLRVAVIPTVQKVLEWYFGERRGGRGNE